MHRQLLNNMLQMVLDTEWQLRSEMEAGGMTHDMIHLYNETVETALSLQVFLDNKSDDAVEQGKKDWKQFISGVGDVDFAPDVYSKRPHSVKIPKHRWKDKL